MAKKNFTQYVLLAAIAVFIVVGIANFGAGPSGSSVEQSTRYEVTVWTCEWNNGWHWTGQTHDYTWKLGSLLSRTEAYCNAGTWTCTDVSGSSIIRGTESAECGYGTEGAVCFCRR